MIVIHKPISNAPYEGPAQSKAEACQELIKHALALPPFRRVDDVINKFCSNFQDINERRKVAEEVFAKIIAMMADKTKLLEYAQQNGESRLAYFQKEKMEILAVSIWKSLAELTVRGLTFSNKQSEFGEISRQRSVESQKLITSIGVGEYKGALLAAIAKFYRHSRGHDLQTESLPSDLIREFVASFRASSEACSINTKLSYVESDNRPISEINLDNEMYVLKAGLRAAFALKDPEAVAQYAEPRAQFRKILAKQKQGR